MSSQHQSRRPQAEPGRGAARFATQVEQSRPDRLVGLVSGLVLLALVVGVPVGMVLLDAVPGLPTSLPTREQLTAQIGPEQLLGVLVWIVWLAWLQFTICVLVEMRSAVSGVGLPARVPLAGPSQRLARTLVASVLLLVTAAGPATALTHSSAPEPATAGPVAAVAVDAPVEADVTSAAEDAPEGEASTAAVPEADVVYRLGDLVLSPEEGAELVGKRVYVVQPPEGRYHDNLWDIAERELSDGRRYQEVFELNRGREQPDGRELSLARLIQPNWLLVMPDDATAVPRVEAVAAPAPADVVETGTAEATPVTPSAPADAEATAVDGAAAEGTGSDVDAGTDAQAPLGRTLMGAGLLAAGLLAAVEQLRRRRRTREPSDDALEVEVALRVGADPARVVLLDRGLRQLAAALGTARRDLPGVVSAVVGDDELRLRLAPAEPDAPAPWRSEDGGRTWVLAVADLDRSARGPAPYPGLVSLGRDAAGADVLLDLEAAQGPVSVVGEPAAVHEVVTALAAELATNRWSDGLRVTGVGLPDGLDALDADRFRAVDDVDAALPRLSERRADVLGSGVLTGRLRGSGASVWRPEYLVLGSAPAPEVAERLVRAASTEERSPIGVVCAGDLPGARWRVVVDGDAVDVEPLGLRAAAVNRLPARAVAGLVELLTPEPEEPARDPAADLDHEPVTDRPAVGTGPVRTLDDLGAAPVRVHVLGAPRVFTPRPVEESRLALCTELVVHLALHPDGVHPSVLAAALWPHGVTPDVRDATVARAADWLGPDEAGRPRLLEGSDGRLRLGDDVVVDWDVVRTLLARARTAATPAAEVADLRAALRLAQGPVLGERPAGRYAWLARARLERRSRDLLVDAAHRLALLCGLDDDPAGARDAAWLGLRVAPVEELLWRDLLRATYAVDGAPGVQDVAADLEATLHGAGVPTLSAPTAALLAELVPVAQPVAGPGPA